MKDLGNETTLENDDAVEALLGQARPRPVPPQADTEAVRAAVQSEWRQVTNRRNRQTRFMQLAIAASVLVAAFLSLNLLRTNGIEPVQVASIDRQFGSVSIITAQSDVLRQPDLGSIVNGQAISTGPDSGVALTWNTGGSLRLDADTRIAFISGTEVFLERGRIYFDSAPALAAISAISGSGAKLTIGTEFGDVTHIGTQYMVETNRSELTVSVRQGVVEVSPGLRAPARAASNQQMSITGSGVRHIVNILPHGDAWRWIERTSPPTNLDGRSVSEFLGWVSQETGMTLHYESEAAASYASEQMLNGTLDTGPREALEAWMLTTDLDWRVEEGVIYVSKLR